METIRVDSTEELVFTLNSYANHFVFRGQANADWGLQSALERIVGEKWSPQQATKFEEFSLEQFKSKFHLYDKENTQPTSKLAWLSIMQHYGVPTRLLDFSESPYVAMYFALESYSPNSNSDLAIYALDYTGIMEKSIEHISARDSGFRETRHSVFARADVIFDETVDRFSYPIVWIAEPRQLNARLDRQAGTFLICGDRGERIESVLSASTYAGVVMHKICFPRSLYPSCFALLRKMNLTSKSLYGDLDGLARAIRMNMQVYAT
ncbi:FRG domain-containing protein [Burkholderia sp. CF099]|nr:FRG domain-containing protein [Burkholderia sp. CF099]